MGIGEAAVTILSETGVPTPVVHTRITPPPPGWDRPTTSEAQGEGVPLWAKYGTRVDNQSARGDPGRPDGPMPAEEPEGAGSQPVRPKQAAAPHRQ